jgi:hypothetical protein
MSIFFHCVSFTCCIWENMHTVNVSLKAILLHAGQAQMRGRDRGRWLPILNLGTRREWVVSTMPWLHYSWERDPVPILQEAGWASGLVWLSLENLIATGFQTLDCPAHNESLYQLHYPSCHKSEGSDVYFGYGVSS